MSNQTADRHNAGKPMLRFLLDFPLQMKHWAE
jgi:hypothetical protein